MIKKLLFEDLIHKILSDYVFADIVDLSCLKTVSFAAAAVRAFDKKFGTEERLLIFRFARGLFAHITADSALFAGNIHNKYLICLPR